MLKCTHLKKTCLFIIGHTFSLNLGKTGRGVASFPGSCVGEEDREHGTRFAQAPSPLDDLHSTLLYVLKFQSVMLAC